MPFAAKKCAGWLGFLWDRDGFYEFAYAPEYVLGDVDSLPLDPLRLPMGAGIWRSKGSAFDGDLSMFGYLEPGRAAENASFMWLSAQLMEASRIAQPRDRQHFPMPQTSLTRLVWASYATTFVQGFNGIRFEPVFEYPEPRERYWLPEPIGNSSIDLEAWKVIRAQYPARELHPPANVFHGIKLMTGGQDAPLDVLRYILPWPGSQVKLRYDKPVSVKVPPGHPPRTTNKPGVLFVEQTARGMSGIRRLRCRSATLRLAAACGIKVAGSDWMAPKRADENGYLWVAASPNNLNVPMVPGPPRLEVVKVDNSSPDPWLADTSRRDVY